MTPAERQQRLGELLAELVELTRLEAAEGPASLDALEEGVGEVGREVTRRALEALLRRQPEPDAPEAEVCPTCQRRGERKGRYGLDVVTSLGRVRVQRRYFYCPACRHGYVPLDAHWRLGPANTSPAAQARVAFLDQAAPYTQVPTALRQLQLPIDLDVSTCEKIAHLVGGALAQQPPAGPAPDLGNGPWALVIQVDGVLFPTRDGYREAQCGVLFEVAPDPPAGVAGVEGGGERKEYFGTVQDRPGLMAEACRRLQARGGRPGQRVGVMGDGARWIWDDFAPQVPCRREILDFYHASEHLGVVAAARFPADAPARERWLTEMRHELRHIGPWRVIREVEQWRPTNAAAQQVRREQLGYLRRNRERMHYPLYVREGFPIGTGAIEGTCKNLVGARLKGAGMRWNADTARPMVHLRAALLTHPDLDLRAYAGRSPGTPAN